MVAIPVAPADVTTRARHRTVRPPEPWRPEEPHSTAPNDVKLRPQVQRPHQYGVSSWRNVARPVPTRRAPIWRPAPLPPPVSDPIAAGPAVPVRQRPTGPARTVRTIALPRVAAAVAPVPPASATTSASNGRRLRLRTRPHAPTIGRPIADPKFKYVRRHRALHLAPRRRPPPMRSRLPISVHHVLPWTCSRPKASRTRSPSSRPR